MKVVIVGGVAGGASAAARIRRLDEHAQIIMIERSGHVSYANCGLPYCVGGVIKEQAELTLQTPESFWDRFRIDVRVRQEVTEINPAEKTVTVRALDSGKVYTETYDKLLLAPGAKPTVPALSGVSSERVFTLRTVEDTLRIRRFVEDQKPKIAVLAGGGFIGLEMAENLAEMGVSVTIVQRPKQLLAPLDADMASFVHAEMRRHGVALRLGETVTGFRQNGDSVLTLLEESEPLHSDMVLLAIGVTPDTHLAKEAGLRLGIRGSIAVNKRMETSVPYIYAVGDAVEVTHFVTGQKVLISLAGPANKQGRIAADNICGGNSRYHGSQGSSVLKLFGLTAAFTGINEKTARAAGIAYDKVVLFPASHAAYYPGAQSMVMKVLYEKESLRLLGAQIVGGDGVDKRIDVLATAIRAKMTALELTELDLSYAPPYSSAKDPVNMSGFMIEDLESGKVRQFHLNDVEDLPCDGSATLLDVRTAWEYQRGHLDGFRNIPLDDLREHLDELDRGKPVYVNCQTGLRSYLACRLLTQYGFICSHLSGGYIFYQLVTQERLSLRNGEAMSENLFGLTVAADKGLDDLQCQRLLSENRRYQEVMLQYRCALKALESRLEILNEEFSLQHDRNPIESMKSRLKSPSSIMNKMQKRGLSLDFPTMQANIMDIAGVRVICSFEEDVFFLAKCLKDQSDIEIITEKDYISHPKPNGYRSLHLTIRLPVFFAEKEIHVPVEIQLRTIAMDFWASLEHTIRYKKNLPINAEIETELKECADSSREWDSKMEHLLHILT